MLASLALTIVPSGPAARDLEGLARSLPVFPTGEILYDRAPALEPLAAIDTSVLIAALQHLDPKVRTLALAGLFAREDPHLLPHIFELAADDAPTLPKPALLALRLPRPPGDPQPTEPQTVADVARAFLEFYLRPAGYHYGVSGYRDNPGFDGYWEERWDRTYCAGWFTVKLARAGGGISPTPVDRIPAIRALFGEIEALPSVDRGLVLLWLSRETGAQYLTTEAELVAAARRLGPDRLLDVLRREPPTDDPDLQPRSINDTAYWNMCRFILEHAEELLRPADARSLLELESSMPSAHWAIAAARLEEAHAGTILRAAFERNSSKYADGERASLALALLELEGKSARPYVVEWFFREFDAQPQGYVAGCLRFLREVGDEDVIRRIATDGRVEQTGWSTHVVLLEQSNLLLGRQIADPDTRYPLLPQQYDVARERALRDYPERTAELLRTLADWRRALRDAWADR